MWNIFTKWFFEFKYRFSKPPWDSGITPPEVIGEVEAGSVRGSRALDLGCGTGTNSIYLARHGYQVVGVDFSPTAIRAARAKALAARVAVEFRVDDVSTLDSISGPFDLALDIGCFHSLSEPQRARYAQRLAQLTGPGSLFMLYAFGPHSTGFRQVGVTEEEIKRLFGPNFALKRIERGSDRGERTSAWYWFHRN